MYFFVQGGATFILIKGVIQMYYRQQQYLRLARRQIKDFVEPISKPPGNSLSTSL